MKLHEEYFEPKFSHLGLINREIFARKLSKTWKKNVLHLFQIIDFEVERTGSANSRVTYPVSNFTRSIMSLKVFS